MAAFSEARHWECGEKCAKSERIGNPQKFGSVKDAKLQKEKIVREIIGEVEHNR